MAKPNFANVSSEGNLQWKMTSNIKDDISQQPRVGSFSNLTLSLFDQNKLTNKDNLQCDKSDISQQPLVRSFKKFKLKLMRPNQTLKLFQMKTTSNGRRPQILNV